MLQSAPATVSWRMRHQNKELRQETPALALCGQLSAQSSASTPGGSEANWQNKTAKRHSALLQPRSPRKYQSTSSKTASSVQLRTLVGAYLPGADAALSNSTYALQSLSAHRLHLWCSNNAQERTQSRKSIGGEGRRGGRGRRGGERPAAAAGFHARC